MLGVTRVYLRRCLIYDPACNQAILAIVPRGKIIALRCNVHLNHLTIYNQAMTDLRPPEEIFPPFGYARGTICNGLREDSFRHLEA